jgi:hypothetical protein
MWHGLGAGMDDESGVDTDQLRINDRAQVTVSSNELFTAAEAAVIFLTFYLTDSVAQPYQLREIDLGNGS